MDSLGTKLRRQRRRLGLTLDELAGRTGISKPYLSLIETGRVPNPPSDQKLSRLEQALGFRAGELISQAHWQRTPQDVKAMLAKMMRGKPGGEMGHGGMGNTSVGSPTPPFPTSPPSDSESSAPVNLDEAYLSGVLQELVDRSAGNVEQVATNAVPIINRVSAGYPEDFTDLSYPPTVADDYVGCPDVRDENAFAARVHGDSMTPKYREGDIVIFSPALPPRSGDDCFIRFEDGQTSFKRVFHEADETGEAVLRLQPRNERYRPQVVPSKKVTGLYKAVFKYEPVNDE